MNKNFFLLFLVALVILIGYPKYLKLITPPAQNSEIAAEQTIQNNNITNLNYENNQNKVEVNHSIITEAEKNIVLENELLKLNITNHGARITNIILKDEYSLKKWQKGIELFKRAEAIEDEFIGSHRIVINKKIINEFKNMPYKYLHHDVNKVILESPLLGAIKVIKEISLDSVNYLININFKIINTAEIPIDFSFDLSNGFSYGETKKQDMRFANSAIKSFDKVLTTKIGKIIKGEIVIEENTNWLAFEDKYFSVILKPAYPVSKATFKAVNPNKAMGYIKSNDFTIGPKEELSYTNQIFAGPKDYKLLKSYQNGFELLVARGFWGNIRLYLLNVLNLLNNVFHNYGIAIIVLTILIKLIFAPLTHKSFESMKKMQELQPKMKALQEKYKEEPQKLNKEVMELYKKHKANPFGGCLPMLLQIPVFIALYQTLSQSVELRGAPFMLWINDLSIPDEMFAFPMKLPFLGETFHLLPILMLLAMVLQQKMTPTTTTSKEQGQMMMLMPIIFGVMFYNFPSGLVLYWLVNNVITIAHQYIHKKGIL